MSFLCDRIGIKFLRLWSWFSFYLPVFIKNEDKAKFISDPCKGHDCISHRTYQNHEATFFEMHFLKSWFGPLNIDRFWKKCIGITQFLEQTGLKRIKRVLPWFFKRLRIDMLKYEQPILKIKLLHTKIRTIIPLMVEKRSYIILIS